MTWSIVARDPETGYFGIAVATRFFAVGALCPWTEAKVGAISTQALVNPALGPRGLALLREGAPAPAALNALMRGDEGRAFRQVHLIDAKGQTAAYTGADCIDWAGRREGEAVSVAGNMLAGPAVVEDTLASYRANMDTPFVERLLLAMDAGEAAGGDKRGKQSAALLIQGSEPYRRLDMRVDDHAEPLVELRRLYGVALQPNERGPDSGCAPERGSSMSDLERDIQAYEAMETDLFKHHIGKWVVFRGGKLVSTFDTLDAAAAEALRRFGRGPYL
ncbi:MAG: DUF1028 domain-containing protein, partial [Proteobacteria bacterium]|nr:DUF1028 domain-containing protein [Pseudomonadota bacterium]